MGMANFDDTSTALDIEQSQDDIDTARATLDKKAPRIRKLLKAKLGEDVYSNWFNALEFDRFDDTALQVSVPVKFLRNWIQSHYVNELLECCRAEFGSIERVDIVLRTPTAVQPRAAAVDARRAEPTAAPTGSVIDRRGPSDSMVPPAPAYRAVPGSLEGSPLDARYTFDTFVVGPSNRMAHAAAVQAAETVLSNERGFNPLVLHSNVGLGKSHLLQAIAWEVKKKTPHAQVLYLTAERFLFQFVEAIRAQEAIAFKNKFRAIDILLIDDFEFMQGDKTEQEFEHIINALLDAGKQLVVAASRHPAQIERLNDRMRSRLQRGLACELTSPSLDLRYAILERRVAEKQYQDQHFSVNRDVLTLLAERLTENGRELEGAINHLFHTWQLSQVAATIETAETVLNSLVQGSDQRRIKIEDILKIISRHYAVTRADIISPRRHRSVVWPRQIGMYLAKQLTARSLPEIGRRFGDRDHTTVLHAIRKIDRELSNNTRLRDEIEALKNQLNRSI